MDGRTSGQEEGRVTGIIESQTSKAPSGLFLGFAVGAMATSLLLKILGKNHWALFVGQWAPSLLIIGNYNKMVKQRGSSSSTRLAA